MGRWIRNRLLRSFPKNQHIPIASDGSHHANRLVAIGPHNNFGFLANVNHLRKRILRHTLDRKLNKRGFTNMETDESSRTNPPYIPLMTLENFVGKLAATVVPPVIDSTLTQSMSGGMAGALMSALKFLGLVDASGNVRDSLKKLVAAHGTEAWKSALAAVIDPAYSSIVEDLDLASATPGMLDDKFRRNSKATGQVLDKAVRFYLAALEKMERPVSPHFKARKPRANGSRKSARTNAARVSAKPATEPLAQDDGIPDGMKTIKLPLIGKSDVILALPTDFNASDWAFLKPILEAYLTRMLQEQND